jgi:26S proteasome regulatory subunit N9
MDFIEKQIELHPDLSSDYEGLGAFFIRKLWHQLSVALETFLKNKNNHRGNNIIELYNNFITKFEARLSQVRLVQLLSMIAHSLKDPLKAIEFINSTCPNDKTRERLGPEASFCLDMDIIIFKLQLGQSDDVKGLLNTAKELLSTLNSTETIVFSKFYKSTSEYHKLVGPAQDFYKSSLMFLAYTPIEGLNDEEKYILATDMCLASIVGANIFNFGEVIATPILSSLKDTPNSWLRDLVIALNRGDVDEFNSIVDTYREQYFAQQALAGNHEENKKKIVLLCLMNIAFERPSHERTIDFSDISTRTRTPLEQVEWVLMRAMSLGLIKGTIDEVDQNINITWVQPRVLDMDQLGLVGNQIDDWVVKVKESLLIVEEQTLELLA